MKEDNLIEINTNSNFPLLKEDSSSLNHSFSINEEPNYKLNNIIQNFSEVYFYATLNPDFVDNNIIYFFFPNEFIIELETMLNDSLNNYPITFRPIKDELIQFSKEKQENEFKKKIGFFPSLKRKISLIKSSEKNSKNERIKAKKIAYLLSQLNSQKKANNNIIYIVYLNKNDSKCNFDYNIFFDEIYNNFSLDIFKNDDSKNIDDIFSKLKRFEDILINNPNIKEKDKKIFINYMILIINKKIIEIEHSYQLELLNDESKKTLKKIRNSIDLLALKYRFQFTHNVKFFYDIEFELIKIIKNNKEEKKAFIEKGNNLEIFKHSFRKEYKNIKNITEPIDENENIKDFNKKCWKNIDTLNKKKHLLYMKKIIVIVIKMSLN